MVFTNYKGSNEAKGQLQTNISASGTTLILSTGQGGLFPSIFPCKGKIEKYDTNGNVIKREIVKITNRSSDILTIVRAHESCPSSYTATSQTATAFSFDVDDWFFLVFTAGTQDDIQTEVVRLETDKLNKSGGTLTGVLKTAKSTDIASTTTTNLSTLTGNFAHITGTTTITSFGTGTAGETYELVFDGILTLTHNATSLILPTSTNITTAVGDTITITCDSTNNWRVVNYQKSNGQSLVANVDITGLTETLTPDIILDQAIIYNVLAGANRKVKLASLFSPFYLGDGSDGNVTITTTVTLTRDMYYNNLTINSPGILDPNGYKIFVKGTLTIGAGGKIRRNGNAGQAGRPGGASAPGAAGATLNQGTLNCEIAAGAGGGSSAAGGAGGTANPSYANYNGAAGGAGVAGGGAGGVSTRSSDYNKAISPLEFIFQGTVGTNKNIKYLNSGGAGGGSHNGGGGGSAGGVIFIIANVFINNGSIEAIGGIGGAATAFDAATGGGGGGNGGIFILYYKTLTTLGTLTLTGGAGGAGAMGGGVGGTGNTGYGITVQI